MAELNAKSLEKAMKDAGFPTYLELAKAANVTRSMIARWRTKKNRPELDNLIKIRDALNRRLSALSKSLISLDDLVL